MSKAVELKRAELLDLVWSKPMSVLAGEFGLSPNGLAKICDRLDIERPPKGYWRARNRNGAAPKPDALSDPDEIVVIGGESSRDRRQRSRMSAEDRRAHMLDSAREIAQTSGLHQVTLKSVARKLGMSEAQAHNIYSTREDLLVELAFEEVKAFEEARLLAIERGGSRLSKVVLSSIDHLRQVSRRGPLLQQILRDSSVRRRVSEMRRHLRAHASQKHVRAVVRDKGIAAEEALASVSVFTALVVRAGELVSEGVLPIEEAERLCLPIVIATAMDGPNKVTDAQAFIDG